MEPELNFFMHVTVLEKTVETPSGMVGKKAHIWYMPSTPPECIV
jgi:hypothetical protein